MRHRPASKTGPAVADISISKEYLDLRSRLLAALRRFSESHAVVTVEFAATESRALAQMTAPPMIEANVEETIENADE